VLIPGAIKTKKSQSTSLYDSIQLF